MKGKSSRKSVRFHPEMGSTTQVAFNNDKKKFQPNRVGLTLEESAKGCSFAVLHTNELRPGAKVLVKVGELPVLAAEVRWIDELEHKLLVVGVQYTE